MHLYFPLGSCTYFAVKDYGHETIMTPVLLKLYTFLIIA